MANVVRAALVQSEWTGDKQSMIDKNVEYARQAAAQGAEILCFQEIFTGPYFCTEQRNEHFAAAEPIPDGPTVTRMMEVAQETAMVLIVPIFEVEDSGHYYNTAAVIDSDGTYLGKYRKTHIPQVAGFWEKFYFRPGNLGYPVFDTAVGRIGVYICYDRHFPEGWRELGLAGAKIVFNPSATTRGHSKYLWELEQPAAGGGQRVLRGGHQPGGKRGPGGHRLLRELLLCLTPRGDNRRNRLRHRRRGDRARPRHGHDRPGPPTVGLLPGPPARHIRANRGALI